MSGDGYNDIHLQQVVVLVVVGSIDAVLFFFFLFGKLV